MRRAGHEGFNLRASEQYQPMQAREAGLTVLDLITLPDAWEDRLKRCAFLNGFSHTERGRPSRLTDRPFFSTGRPLRAS